GPSMTEQCRSSHAFVTVWTLLGPGMPGWTKCWTTMEAKFPPFTWPRIGPHPAGATRVQPAGSAAAISRNASGLHASGLHGPARPAAVGRAVPAAVGRAIRPATLRA